MKSSVLGKKFKKPLVIVRLVDGIPYLVSKPKDIIVEIRDYDAPIDVDISSDFISTRKKDKEGNSYEETFYK